MVYARQVRSYDGYAALCKATGHELVDDIQVERLTMFMVIASFCPVSFTCYAADKAEAIDKFATYMGFIDKKAMFQTARLMLQLKNVAECEMVKVTEYPAEYDYAEMKPVE
jgi:hypothetical protein